MVTLAGVKSGKDTRQLPVAEVQVLLLVDPSGAVTTTVTGVRPGAPVTSTTKPVQPISVQALGPRTPHPEPKAATNTRVIANTARGIVTDRILACPNARFRRGTDTASGQVPTHHSSCRIGPTGLRRSCRSRGISACTVQAVVVFTWPEVVPCFDPVGEQTPRLIRDADRFHEIGVLERQSASWRVRRL